jgi:creatinine amidohydrolase
VALQNLKEAHDEARVYGASWWAIADAGLDAIREAGADGSGHAGETETSMMLTLRPDLVQTDRLHADGGRPPSAYNRKVDRFRRIDEHSSRGNFGDPTFGTADKGERMLEVVIDSLVEIVDDILSDQLSPLG